MSEKDQKIDGTPKKPDEPRLLSSLQADVAQLSSTVGPLHVYKPTLRTVLMFDEMHQASPEARAKAILPTIVSQQSADASDGKREDLAQHLVEKLGDSDITAIADRVRELASIGVVGGGVRSIEPRRPDEAPLSFFDRALRELSEPTRKTSIEGISKWAVPSASLSDSMQSIRDRLSMGSTLSRLASIANLDPLTRMRSELDGKFDSLTASTARLGTLLDQIKPPMPDLPQGLERSRLPDRVIDPPERLMRSPMLDSLADLDKTGKEQRDAALVTKSMTIESAQMLRQLSDTANGVMRHLVQQDTKMDQHVRSQLRIGVVSIVVATMLAAVSAWYAYRAYELQLVQSRQADIEAKAAASREERLHQLLDRNVTTMRENALRLQALSAQASAASASSPRR